MHTIRLQTGVWVHVGCAEVPGLSAAKGGMVVGPGLPSRYGDWEEFEDIPQLGAWDTGRRSSGQCTGHNRSPPAQARQGHRQGRGEAEQDVFIHNIPGHLPPLGQESWLSLEWPQGGQATGASYSIGHLLMLRERKARRAFQRRERARAQVWRWGVWV